MLHNPFMPLFCELFIIKTGGIYYVVKTQPPPPGFGNKTFCFILIHPGDKYEHPAATQRVSPCLAVETAHLSSFEIIQKRRVPIGCNRILNTHSQFSLKTSPFNMALIKSSKGLRRFSASSLSKLPTLPKVL